MKHINRFIFSCILIAHAIIVHSSQFESFYWGYGANRYASITQDTSGLIWLGTNSGLFCYNGYQFYPAVSGSQVHSILVIDKDNLCFTNETGIVFYQISSGHIVHTPLENLVLGRVRVACRIGNDIWFGTEKEGLITYNLTTNTWTIKDKNIGECYALAYDGHNRLYVGGIGGLGYYTINTNKYTSIGTLSFVNSCLWDTHKNCLWIGTDGALIQYTPQTLTLKSIFTYDTNFKCMIRKDNDILLGTDNGLIQYDVETNKINIYSHDLRDSKSICNNAIWNLFKDKDNNIWIGTGHGVSLMHYSPFYTYISLSSIIKDLSTTNNQGNHFSNILRDSKGRYWYAGDNGIILQEQNKTTWFQKESSRYHIPHNIIRRIYEDRNKNIWVATDNGVLSYDSTKKQFITYNITNKNGTQKAEWVYDVYEDRKGRLWVATYGGGLFYADKKRLMSHAYQTYKCNQIEEVGKGDAKKIPNHVYDIKEDSNGNLWLGHRGGLSLLYTETMYVQEIPILNETGTLSHFDIQNLTFDNNGHLWYTVKNALGQINVANHKVVIFPQKSLINNTVSSMSYKNGCLWMTTTNGIKVYNTTTGVFKDLNIPDYEYRTIYYDSQKDDFILGGYDALLNLNPSIYTHTEKAHPIHIVSIVNDNKRLKTNIDYQLKDAGKLSSFPASIKQLTFEISDFCYFKKKPYIYEYQLCRDGKDAEWNKLSSEDNHIIFHELSPDKYILNLRTSLQKSSVSSFTFEIRPPWYLSIWAKIIYFIASCIMLILFIMYLFDRNKRKYERMEKEKSLELSRMKIDFFTNISHDLNTPLSLIIAPLDKMLTEVDDVTLQAQLEGVHRNALRLNTLIQRILDFKRSSYKEEEILMRSRIEVNRLLSTVLASFNQVAETRGITLDIDTFHEEIWLNLDLFKMESIFYNLLSNAIKFVPNDTGCIHIKINKDEDKHTLLVSVKDNGPGIPKEEHNMVWLRLYQGKSKVKKNQGTGIGLYLVKKFVNMHGGTVSLDSTPPNGTTFLIEIPLLGDNLLTQKTKESTTQDNKVEVVENKPKLLIVDDNEELLEFMQSVFSDSYQCFLAHDGQEGLKTAQTIRPDLMIVDEMMPIMSGLKLCAQIRKTSYLASTPIIMLTAKHDHETELKSMKAGVDVFMHKSFELSRLKLRVEQLIESRKLVADKMQQEKMVESTIEVKEDILNSDEKIMKLVLQVIEEHMSDPDFNVGQLCDDTGIGSKKMLRLIKQQTGMTPVNFIRQLRLKKTAILLRQNRFTISEVMHMVGFSHPSYFAKSFTQEFGISPKEYMGKHNKNLDQ